MTPASFDPALQHPDFLMDAFLKITPSINYDAPLVAAKADELRRSAADERDYIRRAYLFVRDEIPHSWDIGNPVVSKNAEEVLQNRTGICWTKSCLFAALLRANGIPSGISYQYLALDETNPDLGHMIHALTTVYLNDQNVWIRLDARGNRGNEQSDIPLDGDILAFAPRPELGERDYHDNHPDLDTNLIAALHSVTSLFDMQPGTRLAEQ